MAINLLATPYLREQKEEEERLAKKRFEEDQERKRKEEQELILKEALRLEQEMAQSRQLREVFLQDYLFI